MRALLQETYPTGLNAQDIPPMFRAAYVTACLHRAQEHFGDTAVKSYLSFSFADTDAALLTSNVTFCTPLPDVLPHIPGLENVTDAAVAELSVEDCSRWS
ncbi:hypothetical protein G3I76_65035 [Streptomyces sp. SID11233]|nr:hypothetical protein [Streptomyces sp. SID11233]